MKIVTVICLFVLSYTKSLGCTCIGDITVKDEFKRSDAVFIGKVITKENFDVFDTITKIRIPMVRYSILVDSFYKGKRFLGRTIDVITGEGSGDCGFKFDIGMHYIIYADYKKRYIPRSNEVPRFLYTNICKRTRNTDKTEIAELNKCKKPKQLL